MMDNHTLLSFVAQRHTIGLEDVATDALSFILSRSESARRELANFLGSDSGPLPIESAQPWAADTHGAVPDLACLDQDGSIVALIESKFWAPLTHHQPVTYWEGLPNDRPSVLLFLAPDYRINPGSLWDELVARLQKAGHELNPAHIDSSLITAPSKDGQRRLMLTSWRSLLDKMAGRALADKDSQASFEIAELLGLSARAISGDNPQRDANLRTLIANAVGRIEQTGWANTEGLTVGQSPGYYYGRYLCLAGAYAWLGIDYKAIEQMPDKPLWLSFYTNNGRVPVDRVRQLLGNPYELGLEWRKGEVCIPIDLPEGADRGATLTAVTTQLERIGRLIDPNGPTYKDITDA